MNEMFRFISSFIKYAFTGKREANSGYIIDQDNIVMEEVTIDEDNIVIDEVTIDEGDLSANKTTQSSPSSQDKLKTQAMIVIFWSIGIMFIASFFVVLYRAAILESEEAFAIIVQILLTTLGCFIGAITTFLGIEKTDRKI